MPTYRVYYLDSAGVKQKKEFKNAQQLLEEMGLTKGTDGFYLGQDTQPFSLEIMGLANPTWESENTIVVEGTTCQKLRAATLENPVTREVRILQNL